MVVGHQDGYRSRPTAAGQALAQRVEAGCPIEGFINALQRQRQPRLSRPFGSQRDQSFDRCRMSGAGGNHVIGFRWEGDQPSLRQCLDGSMDDVAGVIGATEVNNRGSDGRHGQEPKA